MNFKDEMKERKLLFENDLVDFLPEETGYQKTVIQAMNYSILAGGKRLRPILMLETYRLFGGTGKDILPLMVALEMIHTYSLIHDDLPAMDNDMYRRGQLTAHAKYGEDIAILAGDALLNFAVETALRANDLESVKILMQKAGIFGMIGGQTADIEAENTGDHDFEKLMFIHENKTAALVEAAMMIGAIFAGATSHQVKKVEQIAKNVGLAFQIRDDILDVEGDEALLGKPIGSDETNNKYTYITYAGLEKSKMEVAKLTEEAINLFDELPDKNDFLRELLLNLVGRES